MSIVKEENQETGTFLEQTIKSRSKRSYRQWSETSKYRGLQFDSLRPRNEVYARAVCILLE